MILTVCPNTALDKIIFVKKWTPGIPMRTNRFVNCVGGKGLDSSVVLSQLGIETVGLGFFSGKDGRELVDLLIEYGISPDPVWVDGTNRIAYVIAEETTNIHSHVIAGEMLIKDTKIIEFFERYSNHLDNADWVIMAGSIPPCVNDNFYQELIEIAKSKNKPTLVDSQKAFLRNAIKAQPNIVKLNWEEFEWSFGLAAPDFSSLYDNAKSQRRKENIKNFILTLGKEGILALTEEGNFLVKAPTQIPVNAAGAGDAVSSTLVWRLSIGKDWHDALVWASAVSAAAVLTERTGDINMDDVMKILPEVEITQYN